MFRSSFLGAACLLLGVSAAQAGPTRPADAEVQPVQAASPVRPVAAVVREEGTVCTHTRRRFWIENEGWVVRKIATCR
jgi:hypothetical protein